MQQNNNQHAFYETLGFLEYKCSSSFFVEQVFTSISI